MASITIRGVPADTKARLRRQAEVTGRSLEGYLRDLLAEAAHEPRRGSKDRFPYHLIALIEPGEDIEPLIVGHDRPQEPIEL
jgi:plasmid stability protein